LLTANIRCMQMICWSDGQHMASVKRATVSVISAPATTTRRVNLVKLTG
jgi:hypothetical protein